ncbi:Inactive protein RESTRICTED TEV MOVEMENT 2 [Spatholobus suberectus]|nr:Inactive protein RESTRICTED TEV MOVEMENT 2 [Spatholobus suberectus]
MAETDPRSHEAANRVYEDFEPSYEWAQDGESDTLILLLKGFRKENLRVQIGTNRILKLKGEQQISENRWRRFDKEFAIPPHSNIKGIKAKLNGGLLYVRLPKNITEVNLATKSPTPNLEANDTGKKPSEYKTKTKPESTESPTQEEPKTSEVSQTKEMGKAGEDDTSVVQDRAKATTSEAQEMHETIDGLGQGEKKDDQRLPTTFYGLVRELVKQKKVANLLVVIFLILGMGMYVKNAIKSSFGGATIHEL